METYQPVCGNSRWSIVKIKPIANEGTQQIIDEPPQEKENPLNPPNSPKPTPPVTVPEGKPKYILSGKREQARITLKIPSIPKPTEPKHVEKTVFRISSR